MKIQLNLFENTVNLNKHIKCQILLIDKQCNSTKSTKVLVYFSRWGNEQADFKVNLNF